MSLDQLLSYLALQSQEDGVVGFVLGVAVCASFYFAMKYIAFVRHQKQAGEAPMTSIQRQNEIKALVADGITDVFEDMRAEGKLSPEEVEEIYARVGNVLSIPDLLQRGKLTLKQKLLNAEYQRQRKREISKRLAIATHYPPAPLPAEPKKEMADPITSAMKG